MCESKGSPPAPPLVLRQDIQLGRGLCSSDPYTPATRARARITSWTPRVPSGVCRREGEGLPVEPGRWEARAVRVACPQPASPLPWQPREERARETVFSVSLTKTLACRFQSQGCVGQLLGFKSQSGDSEAVQPWANDSPSLRLCVLICKVVIIVAPASHDGFGDTATVWVTQVL